MKPIIFIGPSISREKAESIFPHAEYRAPAKKGDILRIATRMESNIIGLIDGVFLQDYPPTPIEIYTALMKGIKIIGAASIGAVRAVELEKFGMIGIGSIYRLYKMGKLDDDDEIAVTFTSDYKLQSEAMIDIRYTLYHAYKNKILTYDKMKYLLKIAKNIYFPYRTYEEIFNKANIDERVIEYVKKNRRSLKEKDSIALLNYLKHYI
ncbi:MAG: TfuA-like protein [Candidatus Nitrosocaldaceae archaeon]